MRLGNLFITTCASLLLVTAAPLRSEIRTEIDSRAEDVDDDMAVSYNYTQSAKVATDIVTPGTSGNDDDDAVAYT
ncbi:hypothetical protein N0V93_009812 [Gnomoniopsis smithogilvyi]|uniref:Uncharacterized protein n=1 Tax=Gnomoniopsis smithogilvyi TaxID=1191159 RepID=A0A9W8YL61_9PEZI|nr:hypothetical protein N0V93_009812 [Gnomoniopsis smithogilvyi]